MHSEWSRSTFVRALKFLPIKGGGDLISGVNHLCRKSELFVLHLLYFNFKIFKDRNFSLIITFQCILLDYGWPFSEISNFYKLKIGNLISGGENKFCRKSELFMKLTVTVPQSGNSSMKQCALSWNQSFNDCRKLLECCKDSVLTPVKIIFYKTLIKALHLNHICKFYSCL